MKMEEMSKELGLEIPKGANDIVDETGKEIAKKFGINKLNTIAKLNFKNTEKIKEALK